MRAPSIFALVLSSLFMGAAAPAAATGQSTPTQAAPAPRLIGTVAASTADSLTLKLESGGQAIISVTPDTRLLRTAPGAKTLAGATVIQITDLAPGDRILVRATPGPDASHFIATAVISMKQADIAQAQQQAEQDWQRRGVSGVVKSVDTATGAGSIVLATAQPGRTVTVLLTPKTIVRRYSQDSVKFADAKMSTLDQIHPGDQLRARGDRQADGMTAEEVVAGTFRNIAGTVTSVDAGAGTLILTDLATKKAVTLTLNADTQARKLPPEMAQRIAARLKGATGSEAGSGSAGGAGTTPRPETLPATGGQPANPGATGAPGRNSSADLSTLLQRAPAVALTDLKKGDAVMVVATQGTPTSATAITLLAGVESLLQASPNASRDVFSASWNLGGSPGGGDAAQ